MSSPQEESSPLEYDTSTTPHGLHLRVDFSWRKWKNQISEKNGGHLEPVYIQHFRAFKPHLKFNSITDGPNIASGTINYVSISAECQIHGRHIDLKPLKRWKTHYNYLSPAAAPTSDADPVPVCWIANSSLKLWDFVCLDARTQMPIAKFSVNWWAVTQVGNFYFEKPKESVSKELRDEVVVTGLTLLYVMAARMNNPLNLLGAALAKPGKVEAGQNVVELQEREEEDGKVKRL